jgi:acetyltransferase-like isoleucine patch superfamily enzyme
MNIKRLKINLFLSLMNLPMRRQKRWRFARWAGVNIGPETFIGRNVTFDSMYPEKLKCGTNVHIADGCVFLTHYLDTSRDGIHFVSGEIELGNNVFIGTNAIISKPVKIGDNVIIGAGSIVTKDIPANEIWAGNPARLIKKR